jgi:5-(carboxyamino)imidazole ribonucleotide synthase
LTTPPSALAPGASVGILGGGQLGRMLALAAAKLGLRTHIYSDEADCPAFDVASECSHGDFTDFERLEPFARSVDVVTYEFENVPVEAAEFLSGLVPVRPGPTALAVSQDRLAEKEFLASLGIPVAPFTRVDDCDGLRRAIEGLGAPAILKTRRYGYDGKGQVSVLPGAEPAATLAAIANAPAVLERRLTFAFEVSALVVRALDGAVACYDIPVNTHQDGILRRSIVPSALGETERGEARSIAERIAAALDYTGVLAVEMFYMGADAEHPLVVNEIAPRVHNSGHWTMDACAISQFENHIRAVAGWPLGSTERHSDAEMTNILGAEALAWAEMAADPGALLHLYGKRQVREGRKMGHLNRLRPRSA